jgi:predicted peptidase
MNDTSNSLGDAELLRKSYVSTVSGEAREYFLYLPQGYAADQDTRWPVILFLHGGGERGDGKAELELVLKHGPLKEAWTRQRDLPFVMIAPQMPPYDEDARRELEARRSTRPPPAGPPPLQRGSSGEDPRWNDEGPPLGWWTYEQDVMRMLDDTLSEYRTDAERVYLTGLSYGGFGAWHFAATHPERWAAMAPICGAARRDAIASIAEAKLPIWIFTGGKDRVVRPEWVLESAAALEAAGHPEVRFTVHEDCNHDVWSRVYGGADLYDWLLEHRC